MSASPKKVPLYIEEAVVSLTQAIFHPVSRVYDVFAVAPLMRAAGGVGYAALVHHPITVSGVIRILVERHGVLGLWRGAFLKEATLFVLNSHYFRRLCTFPDRLLGTVFGTGVGEVSKKQGSAGRWGRIAQNILRKFLTVALVRIVTHPAAVVMATVNVDLSHRSTFQIVASFLSTKQLGVLYVGYDVAMLATLVETVLSEIAAEGGATSEQPPNQALELLKFLSSIGTGVVNELMLRMIATRQPNALETIRSCLKSEGELWWIRGITMKPLLMLVSIAAQLPRQYLFANRLSS